MVVPQMFLTLEEYNNLILSGAKLHVKLVFTEQQIELTDDDISASGGLTITQMLNPDDDLTFGRAVSSELVVHLLNGDKFTNFDWTDEFKLSIGIERESTTYYITYGRYKGTKPERVSRTETIEFHAMDRMSWFDVLADEFIETLEFPATMETIYDELCAYIGVENQPGDELSSAMSISYPENPFPAGATCRQILAWIAEANCCYAKVMEGYYSGYVQLVWYRDHTSDYAITEDNYYSLDISENNTPVIDSIRISSSDGEQGYIYPTSGNNVIYNIVDNHLLLNMPGGMRTTVTQAILSRLSAFGAYTPVRVSAICNPAVETGDIISVSYDNGSTVNMPIFARVMHWNGAGSDDYECSGKATRSEMTESVKEKYNLATQVANKYTIRSGVDITDDGVTVSGGKYVKIKSGGVFDVQATNMEINSEWGYLSVFDTVDSMILIGWPAGRSVDKLRSWFFHQESDGKYYLEISVDDNKTSDTETYKTALRLGCKSVYKDGNTVIVPCLHGFSYARSENDEQVYVSSGDIAFTNCYFDHYYGSGVKNNLLAETPGYVLDARQGKVLNDSIGDLSDSIDDLDSAVVHKAQAEEISGTKWFHGDLSTGKTSRYKRITFKNNGGEVCGHVMLDSGSSTTQMLNRISLVQYSPNYPSTASGTGFYEQYNLPIPDTNLSANKTYNIVTTKDPRIMEVSYTLTSARSTVTIDDANCVKVGSVVTATMRITTSASISNGNSLVGGLPHGKTTLVNGRGFAACAVAPDPTVAFAACNLTNGTYIVASTVIPAGTYVITVSYVTDD